MMTLFSVAPVCHGHGGGGGGGVNVVMFYLVIISDAIDEFLPADDTDLLN